jgi:hypothetical protein
MVMSTEREHPIVHAIRRWFGGLPPGTARLSEEVFEYEHVIRMIPTNPKACPVELRVSNYGTFGLHLGKGFAFEDIPSSIDLVLDICESIREGRVSEQVREWRGKVVGTRGVVELSSGSLRDRGSTHWAALLPVGANRQIQYEPWSTTVTEGNVML